MSDIDVMAAVEMVYNGGPALQQAARDLDDWGLSAETAATRVGDALSSAGSAMSGLASRPASVSAAIGAMAAASKAPLDTLAGRFGALAGNVAGLAGRYSPEHGSALAGFSVGRALRIASVFGQTRRHFTGWVKSIQPAPGQRGPRRTRVEVEGYLARAQRHPAEPPVQVGKTADELVAALLRATNVYPPGFHAYWLAGVPAHSELGLRTRLGEGALFGDFETGISTFAYAFDNSARNASLYAQLRLVAESEQGRVFADREGRLVFWNRHHLPKLTAPVASFEGSMFDLDYRYGESLANHVTIQHNPRKLEDSGPYTLATMDRSGLVQGNSTLKVTLRYKDDSGARVSTTDPIDPEVYVDWRAVRFAGNDLKDETGNFSVTAEHKGQSSEWTITNTGSYAAFVGHPSGLYGATQRANNRLTDFGQMEAAYRNEQSIAAYGLQALSINARLLESADAVFDMARWMVETRKTPQGEPRSVGFKPRRSVALLEQALARTIGDRISVQEAQTGLDADYVVIGERHSLASGGLDYRVEWLLEPAVTVNFWQLGVEDFSEIGQTTVAAY